MAIEEKLGFGVGERNAMISATGTIVAVFTNKYIPQFLGKFTNLIVGIVLLFVGTWLPNDSASYFVIGYGLFTLVNGAVSVFAPQFSGELQPSTQRNYSL